MNDKYVHKIYRTLLILQQYNNSDLLHSPDFSVKIAEGLKINSCLTPTASICEAKRWGEFELIYRRLTERAARKFSRVPFS